MAAWEERTYAMQFSDALWNTFNVYYAAGVPAFGLNITGTNLYLTDKRIDPDPGDQTVVRCICRFETPKPDQRQPHTNATMSVWSVVKSISSVPIERAVEKDIDGKVCVNVLGEVFNPPITVIQQDAQFDIKFLTNSSVSQMEVVNCEGFVNSAAFTLTVGACPYFIDAGEFYLEKTNISDAWDENGSRCSAIQLLALFRDNSSLGSMDAWHEFRPNLSLNKANDTTSPAAHVWPITNEIGMATEPKYLDSHGVVILPGGTITMNEFKVKGTANMMTLLSGLLD